MQPPPPANLGHANNDRRVPAAKARRNGKVRAKNDPIDAGVNLQSHGTFNRQNFALPTWQVQRDISRIFGSARSNFAPWAKKSVISPVRRSIL